MKVLAQTDDRHSSFIDALSIAPTEISYAQNITATTTPVTSAGVYVPIPGLVIAVPPTTASVYLKWDAQWHITTAGAGGLYLSLQEVTFGSQILAMSSVKEVLAADSGAATLFPGNMPGEFRLGPNTFTYFRIFELFAVLLRDAASSLAAEIRNASFAPSFLLAEAR